MAAGTMETVTLTAQRHRWTKAAERREAETMFDQNKLWGTVGVAIGGWAPTVRLVIVLIVITICYCVVMSAR